MVLNCSFLSIHPSICHLPRNINGLYFQLMHPAPSAQLSWHIFRAFVRADEDGAAVTAADMPNHSHRARLELRSQG